MVGIPGGRFVGGKAEMFQRPPGSPGSLNPTSHPGFCQKNTAPDNYLPLWTACDIHENSAEVKITNGFSDLNPQILHLQAATYNDDPFSNFLLKQVHVYLVAGELV